jgi:hypothetical protein
VQGRGCECAGGGCLVGGACAGGGRSVEGGERVEVVGGEGECMRRG